MLWPLANINQCLLKNNLPLIYLPQTTCHLESFRTCDLTCLTTQCTKDMPIFKRVIVIDLFSTRLDKSKPYGQACTTRHYRKTPFGHVWPLFLWQGLASRRYTISSGENIGCFIAGYILLTKMDESITPCFS